MFCLKTLDVLANANVLSIRLSEGLFCFRNSFNFVLNYFQKSQFLPGAAHPDLNGNPFLLVLIFY